MYKQMAKLTLCSRGIHQRQEVSSDMQPYGDHFLTTDRQVLWQYIQQLSITDTVAQYYDIILYQNSFTLTSSQLF